ncbi:SRPBCC family protein [Plebeiibacterium marinum]|uniref:GyrI-like domain-containing protein n=1 Tax=Plebeiibacterium marinum TaxID=2992111 RepID=A0AAE3SKM3_9BACT|nr:GyrI-like domain-containing protein [Plebeiobacterium marinum]MCW3806574.1 GyrI-like domain-containing protein [Plebeiobacterium marinum]
MKKFFIATLVVVAMAIAGTLIWLYTLEGNYKVERNITINKASEEVFDLIVDFNKWGTWSPWLCMEPGARVEVSGSGFELDNEYRWEGELVGSGVIKHTEIVPRNYIKQEIRFIKPFESSSLVYWNFKIINDSVTNVTWGMQGEMPFLFRFMTKMMEPMVGMDYERGLKMIKDYAEKGYVASDIKIDGIVDCPSFKYVGEKVACELDEVGSTMPKVFGNLKTMADERGLDYNRALSLYHEFDFFTKKCVYTAAVPVMGEVTVPEPWYQGEIPSVKAVKITFKGDYEHLGNAWSAGMSYMQVHKLSESKEVVPFEVYINDPKVVADERQWVTEVYMPIK